MVHVLLFDADCGFCTRSARWLGERASSYEMVPWQGFDIAAHGITAEAAAERIHAVDGDHVRVGHEAIAAALRGARPRWLRAAGRVVGSRALAPIASRAYDWTAAHRHQLPGGTAACELPRQES